MLLDENIQARDAEDARIAEEAQPVAEKLRDLLLSMTDSDKRLGVLDVLKNELCFKCGDRVATYRCWCDYSTPLD